MTHFNKNPNQICNFPNVQSIVREQGSIYRMHLREQYQGPSQNPSGEKKYSECFHEKVSGRFCSPKNDARKNLGRAGFLHPKNAHFSAKTQTGLGFGQKTSPS